MVATIAPMYESPDDSMFASAGGCGAARLSAPELVDASAAAPSTTASSSSTSSSSSPSPSAVETEPTTITLRPMGIDDIDQVRELHEQWFPIRYQQSFYEGAAQGVWRETGFPLFTRLAAEASTHAVPVSHDRYGFMDWSSRPPAIYGAVMASTIPLTSVEDSGLLAPDDYTHTHAMYILTLGSRASMRRRGLASTLVAQCVEEARRQPRCGAVYLHVKADNVSALRFYEKNGFQNLRFLEDYYVIDGVRHSAYLYILYVNGAAPHSGWLGLLTKPIMALFSMAAHGFKRLLVGLADESKASHHQSHRAATARRKAPPPPLVDDSHVSRLSMVSPPSSPHVISVV